MDRPQPKGWCPTTLVPMQSGDGLIVRVKPPFGRLTSDQANMIADVARQYGNGFLDITSRANIQIRGVLEAELPSVISYLQKANLASSDTARDRLNLIIAPFTEPDMIGWHCAMRLYDAAHLLPDLPAKFGFTIDCGQTRYLTKASGDIRIETDEAGGLTIRCDGQPTGFQTSLETMVDDIQNLLAWYVAQSQDDQTQDDQTQGRQRVPRMAQLAKSHILPERFQTAPPQPNHDELGVGTRGDKQVIAVPFGQCHADNLAWLAGKTKEITVSVNRCLIVDKGATDHSAFITSPDDRRQNIMVCPGAPFCASAEMPTRPLAQKLADSGFVSTDKTYHVSGCSKGCAAPRATDICIIGTASDYAIIENGCAWDSPSITSLSSDDVFEKLK